MAIEATSIITATMPAILLELQHADARLFMAIHPAVAPNQTMLRIMRGLADLPLRCTFLIVLVMVAFSRLRLRLTGCAAIGLGLMVLMTNGLIGLIWARPRPFVAGLGQAWIQHAASSSFPSNHLSLQWAIGGFFLLHRRSRWLGVLCVALGFPMAWARVWLGVHYPGDMVGAFILAGCSTTIAYALIPRCKAFFTDAAASQ